MTSGLPWEDSVNNTNLLHIYSILHSFTCWRWLLAKPFFTLPCLYKPPALSEHLSHEKITSTYYEILKHKSQEIYLAYYPALALSDCVCLYFYKSPYSFHWGKNILGQDLALCTCTAAGKILLIGLHVFVASFPSVTTFFGCMVILGNYCCCTSYRA